MYAASTRFPKPATTEHRIDPRLPLPAKLSAELDARGVAATQLAGRVGDRTRGRMIYAYRKDPLRVNLTLQHFEIWAYGLEMQWALVPRDPAQLEAWLKSELTALRARRAEGHAPDGRSEWVEERMREQIERQPNPNHPQSRKAKRLEARRQATAKRKATAKP